MRQKDLHQFTYPSYGDNSALEGSVRPIQMKRIARATLADGFYHFGCTVSFDCPICGRHSVERILCEARRPEAEPVAKALSRDNFDCQYCGALLTERKKLSIQVMSVELERLRELGFAVPQAA